jgi:hypothetical protein
MLTVKPYDKESDRVRYIATSFSFKNSPELRFKKNLLNCYPFETLKCIGLWEDFKCICGK